MDSRIPQLRLVPSPTLAANRLDGRRAYSLCIQFEATRDMATSLEKIMGIAGRGAE